MRWRIHRRHISHYLIKLAKKSSFQCFSFFLSVMLQLFILSREMIQLVTNPTFRTRIKGKTGTRGDPPKSDKTDDVLTALPVKIGKVTQQAKSGKTEKAESRGTDKLGSISAGGLSGAEDLSIHRKSIVEPILSSAVSLEKKSTAKSTTKASTSAVPAGLTPIITAASELNQTTIKKGK
ncbi:hypothetical protein QVD99_005080 [Batrachochytrium dendrobatidis]|nr:hypothetical protein QVD99_005080 [Batrachochytrium dendrobatidis]